MYRVLNLSGGQLVCTLASGETLRVDDKKTKEVIKELPPEKTLDMIAKAWEIAGILVDEKR